MILAHPHNKTDSVKLTKNFQFAPSGSLLFKLGSRKSNFYNEFLDPGLGFNFSAPHFDLDGTPDFATGVIVTVIQDILSFGWNYNTRTDTPFIFLGISLPFSTPGLPVNSVQVQSLDELNYAAERILVVSIASCSVSGGRIVGNRFASIVLSEQG